MNDRNKDWGQEWIGIDRRGVLARHDRQTAEGREGLKINEKWYDGDIVRVKNIDWGRERIGIERRGVLDRHDRQIYEERDT